MIILQVTKQKHLLFYYVWNLEDPLIIEELKYAFMTCQSSSLLKVKTDNNFNMIFDIAKFVYPFIQLETIIKRTKRDEY